ncbi:hypothetical protein C0581_00715 [Candidatus Parcubacteria bacterium]|nr:MAG: hypothetical protein C0581_00715 [Candidatus Parcubacteria bacterium]
MPVGSSTKNISPDASQNHEKALYLCEELEKELQEIQKEGQTLKIDILHALDKYKMSSVLQNIIDLPQQ